jgi:hypothetical protein
MIVTFLRHGSNAWLALGLAVLTVHSQRGYSRFRYFGWL